MTLDVAITSDTTFAVPQRNDVISKAVYASGQVEFSSKSGYVRILLTDDYGYDLLVYESFPLLATKGIDVFDNAALETGRILSSFSAAKFRIEIKNAELKNLLIDASSKEISEEQQRKMKIDRIALINNNLRDQNEMWVADETSVSQLSYEEKKNLFGGNVPDLQGIEYYVGGIFELTSDVPNFLRQVNGLKATSSTNDFVSSFDWRNRHGKNWNTSVKNQYSCNSCWAFGAVGAVEGLVNLYYNRKIDLDLSEQQIISCTGKTCSDGGLSMNALNYIIADGVVNETCFPNGYTSNPPCSNKCNNPAENITIAGMQVFIPASYPDPVSELKKQIIQKGIIGGRISTWSHAMTLVGFGTVEAGDTVYNGIAGGYSTPIIIEAGDSRIGETYWIFKNSWGSSWGSDGGYLYAISDIDNLTYSAIPLSPITSLNYTDADIVCEDRDGDGYYFWGVGPKPATCPACVPAEPDGDDSNPNLGPMDEYGNCEPITPLAENITTSQTWSTNRTLCKNLVVQPGATLTITATVFMQAHKVTIQNGGKIILSGGTIDNGNVTAQNGSELTITNNGKILLGNYDNLDIQLGAIFDNAYGEILMLESSAKPEDNTIVRPNSSWSVLQHAVLPLPLAWVATQHIYFNGDSTVAGKAYKKVFSCDDRLHENIAYEGLLREQDKKTYFLPKNSETEYLLYDFSLEEGMTLVVRHPEWESSALYVKHSDTIEINGKPRKRLQLSYPPPRDREIADTWIEGIGSLLYGILQPHQLNHLHDGVRFELLCHHESDELAYKNPTYSECHYDRGVLLTDITQ